MISDGFVPHYCQLTTVINLNALFIRMIDFNISGDLVQRMCYVSWLCLNIILVYSKEFMEFIISAISKES